MMGIDVDRPGYSSTAWRMGNFNEEMTSLYVNAEGLRRLLTSGRDWPSYQRPHHLWGTFVDYDNDVPRYL